MATWKKVHVEDANTTHGTITATLGDNTTDGAAGEVELVMVGGTGEQELQRQTYNFGAAAFLSAAQVITNGSGLTSSDFQKDLVGGTGISGSANDVLFGSDSDLTLDLDINGLTASNGNITVATGDLVPLYDADGNATYKATVSELVGAVTTGVTGLTFQGDDDNSGSLTGAVQLTLTGGDAITTTQTTAGNISGITIDLDIGSLGTLQPSGNSDEFVFENNDGTYNKVGFTNLAKQILDGGEITATTLTSSTIAGGDTFLVADGGRGGTANDITLTQLTNYFNDASVLTALVDTNTDVDVNTSNLITRLGQISENVTIGDASDVTVTITGNLVVNGASSSIDVQTLTVEDKLITVADGAATAANATSSGIQVDSDSSSANYANFVWADTNLGVAGWQFKDTGAAASFPNMGVAALTLGSADPDSAIMPAGAMWYNDGTTGTAGLYVYTD